MTPDLPPDLPPDLAPDLPPDLAPDGATLPRRGRPSTLARLWQRSWPVLLALAAGVLMAVEAPLLYWSVSQEQRALVVALRGRESGGAVGTSYPQDADAYLQLYTGDPERVRTGYELFVRHCAACHGDEADGATGPSFLTGFRLQRRSDVELLRTITEGRPERGMPAWGQALPTEQRAQIVLFLRSLQEHATAGMQETK